MNDTKGMATRFNCRCPISGHGTRCVLAEDRGVHDRGYIRCIERERTRREVEAVL